jgi:4-hydroxy-tetrahydrodipicolinate reductase
MEQPTDVQDVRVVHFGLGPLGAAIARVVAGREGLVSVAAYDPNPARAGRDLGEVAGLGAAGSILIDSSAESLPDIDADVVMFAPEGDLDATTTDLELLLESGLNVVTILPELAYPPDDEDDDMAVSIDTLAREAEVTALALDPSDALFGTVALSMTSICSHVDRVVVRHRGASSGAGAPGRLSLGDWSRSLSEALGWVLDDLDELEEEHGGQPRGRHRIVGSMDGREVLVVESAADPSATGSTVEIEIEGTPSLRLSTSADGDATEALATLAVNAIPAVLTNDPGLYALSDLPPVHYWTSLGLMPASDEDDDDLDSDL